MIIRNPSYRQPPPPGALDRYAVNLKPNPLGALGIRRRSRMRTATSITTQRLPAAGGGEGETVALTEAAAAVKEYFDVSVYRNILDMIQTFEGVLNRFGQAVANELCCVGRQSRIQGGIFSAPAGYGNGDPWTRIGQGNVGLQLSTAIGYAAPLVGGQNKNEAQVLAQQKVKEAGLACGQPVGFFEVPDLLNLSRTINYEMNRVRLPVPHNFRQIANAIQGRDFRLCSKWHNQMPNLPSKPSSQQWKYGSVRGRYMQQLDAIFSANYINGVELLKVYTDLKKSMAVMRAGVRKEIDKANIAAKVQEQTIRREQEELISRQQAEEQAKKRELEILAEKKAQYEKDMAEAERIKNEMAETTAQMQAELEQLAAAREAAQTPAEVEAVEEKAAEVVTAAELAAQMERDYTENLATTVAAAGNLQDQIRTVQYEQAVDREQAAAEGIPTKPGIPAPLILTAAAGLLLL